MELIADTTFKKMAPKKGFLAPYIQFPWGHDRALIGKPVSIYRADGGYFLSIESNEFKPLDVSKVKANITRIRNNEFKPNEKTNTTLPESENDKKTGLKGFEPLTCGLRVRRYAELSYRPMLC